MTNTAIDVTNPSDPDAGRTISEKQKELVECPVPGCTQQMIVNALGPHLKMHRNRQDPGTPPPKNGKTKSRAKAATATAPVKPKANGGARGPYKPKVQPRVSAVDVVDGVLGLLYPNGVPLARVREVTAWMNETERLATDALAAQEEEPPS
jgi:hypothetical protein